MSSLNSNSVNQQVREVLFDFSLGFCRGARLCDLHWWSSGTLRRSQGVLGQLRLSRREFRGLIEAVAQASGGRGNNLSTICSPVGAAGHQVLCQDIVENTVRMWNDEHGVIRR